MSSQFLSRYARGRDGIMRGTYQISCSVRPVWIYAVINCWHETMCERCEWYTRTFVPIGLESECGYNRSTSYELSRWPTPNSQSMKSFNKYVYKRMLSMLIVSSRCCICQCNRLRQAPTIRRIKRLYRYLNKNNVNLKSPSTIYQL